MGLAPDSEDFSVWFQTFSSFPFFFVVYTVEDIPHRFQTSLVPVMSLNNNPWAVSSGSLGKHDFLVLGKVVPAVLGLHVRRAEFPMLERVGLPFFKASLLFLIVDAKPEFDDG